MIQQEITTNSETPREGVRFDDLMTAWAEAEDYLRSMQIPAPLVVKSGDLNLHWCRVGDGQFHLATITNDTKKDLRECSLALKICLAPLLDALLKEADQVIKKFSEDTLTAIDLISRAVASHQNRRKPDAL